MDWSSLQAAAPPAALAPPSGCVELLLLGWVSRESSRRSGCDLPVAGQESCVRAALEGAHGAAGLANSSPIPWGSWKSWERGSLAEV